MAEINLVALLFRAQSLHRKPTHRRSARSRKRTTLDEREILSGYQYEKRRREVLKRDGYRCALCSSAYLVEVHHKTKRSLLRDDRAENLISLCERCHGAAHQE
jgi:5-methylcytosine-specific restriction endonuclease McrA